MSVIVLFCVRAYFVHCNCELSREIEKILGEVKLVILREVDTHCNLKMVILVLVKIFNW